MNSGIGAQLDGFRFFGFWLFIACIGWQVGANAYWSFDRENPWKAETFCSTDPLMFSTNDTLVSSFSPSFGRALQLTGRSLSNPWLQTVPLVLSENKMTFTGHFMVSALTALQLRTTVIQLRPRGNTDTIMSIYCQFSSCYVTFGAKNYTTPSFAPGSGTWFETAIVYDGSTFVFYYNGAEYARTEIQSSIAALQVEVFLGGSFTSSVEVNCDEIRLFQTALNVSALNAIHALTSTPSTARFDRYASMALLGCSNSTVSNLYDCILEANTLDILNLTLQLFPLTATVQSGNPQISWRSLAVGGQSSLTGGCTDASLIDGADSNLTQRVRFFSPGTFDIVASVTDANGCDKFTVRVNVLATLPRILNDPFAELFQAAYLYNGTVYLDQLVNLTASIAAFPAAQVHWVRQTSAGNLTLVEKTGGGSSDSSTSEESSVHFYLPMDTVALRLYAINSVGVSTTNWISVQVRLPEPVGSSTASSSSVSTASSDSSGGSTLGENTIVAVGTIVGGLTLIGFCLLCVGVLCLAILVLCVVVAVCGLTLWLIAAIFGSSAGVIGSTVAVASAGSLLLRRQIDQYAAHVEKNVIDYRELDRDELKILRLIGEGAFGRVFHGQYRETDVAIKELHGGSLDEAALQEFRHEAALMQLLGNHPNVVEFVGVVTRDEPMYMVTAYCRFGSLFDLLIKNRAPVEPVFLMSMARDIAAGVRHLHQNQLLHRDIAARNCLVGDDFSVHVSDFGMSRFVERNPVANAAADTETKRGPSNEDDSETDSNHNSGTTTAGGKYVDETGIGAVRWMAPESMLRGEYSEASDAYSYGVTLWEMVTRKQPFEGYDVTAVVQLVGLQRAGLPIPSRCPPILRTIMEGVFEYEPEKRLGFEQILALLEPEIQNHEEELERMWERLVREKDPSQTDDSSIAATTSGQFSQQFTEPELPSFSVAAAGPSPEASPAQSPRRRPPSHSNFLPNGDLRPLPPPLSQMQSEYTLPSNVPSYSSPEL